MAATQSRYLGVQPFKTSDKHIFFGRDEDIENLHDFIMLEKLIVLFGKSGYGKSSILNAGIVPKLTDDTQPQAFRFRPVEVRLGTFVDGQSFAPTDTMKWLLENVPITEGSDFLTNLSDEDTLWRQFKQRQTAANGQFVLIFDQFEEFFSYPLAQQATFRRQLAELLYSDIPQSVRAKLDTLTDEQRRFVVKPMNIKAVFAIRSDRMSLLDSMKDVLPAILHKRYELRPLSPSQAREAIVEPANIENARFSSPRFEYTEGALSAIIRALSPPTSPPTSPPAPKGGVATSGVSTPPSDARGDGGSPPLGAGGLGIEAFQLQIVCEYIENLVKNGQVPDINGNGLPDITDAQLPEMKSLYRNYYHRKLAELDARDRAVAQSVLEDGLLAEDSATGEGRRTSVDSLTLINQFKNNGLTMVLLEKLEKTYLIRREVNTVGGFSFEISHDTLVEPIQEAKKERQAIEEAARWEREQIEKEKLYAEAQRQANIERKRRQRATALAVVSGLLFLVSAFAGFYAFQKQKEANLATIEALNQKNKADDNFKLAEKRAIEAKNNADSATIARIDAEKNYKLALEQKGIAADALKKAEENFVKAKQNEDKALKALDDALAANVRVVSAYLRDIDQHILKIEYEAAFEKCQKALDLNVENQKPELTKRVLEIAYFYTETDTLEAAIKTLNLLKINALQNRIALLSAIEKNAPPQYFTFLKERYYPKMIAVEGGSFLRRFYNSKTEKDSVNVKVSSFKMAEAETTVWQYFLYLKAKRQKPRDTPAGIGLLKPSTNIKTTHGIAFVGFQTDRTDF